MKPIITLMLLTLAIMSNQVLGSVFLDQMIAYLNAPGATTLQSMLAWQIGGIVVPLAAGPVRCIAYMLWTSKFTISLPAIGGVALPPVNVDGLKAKLWYNYGITTFDQFYGYFINYAIYGVVYPQLGWKTTFKEIPLMDNNSMMEIMCYTYNGATVQPTKSNTNYKVYNDKLPDCSKTLMWVPK